MWNRISSGNLIEGKYYLTCIQKFGEISNVQKMKKVGNLWFCEDGTYVYYTPTHFKLLENGCAF